jgi:CAAD domains of cyanobacterial aminoacyl-tRNA synthetase
MKLDVVLHEIMRIDEYAETDAETISAETAANNVIADDESSISVDPATTDALVKDEVTTESMETSTPAEPPIADEEVPISVDPATAEALLKDEELPTESMVDTPNVAKPAAAEESPILVVVPTEPVAATEEMPIPVDPATAKALLKDWELPTESIDTAMAEDTSGAEPVVNYDELLGSDPLATETVVNYDNAPTESAELLASMQTKVSEFFDEAMSSVPAFFKANQQLLTTLGLIFLAVIGIKVTFAGLNAIDDIPLVTPLLKLVGLVYVARFIWNYVLRAQDRQQLAQKFDRLKAEVLGTQN